MALGDTFDLGRIIQSAEAIKGMRRQTEEDAIRRQYLQAQIANTQQAGQIAGNQEQRAQQGHQVEMDARTARTKYLEADAILRAEDPLAAVNEFAPELVQHFEQKNGPGSFSKLAPEQVKKMAGMARDKAAAVAGINIAPDPDILARQQFQQQHSATEFERQKELAQLEHRNDLSRLSAQQRAALELERERSARNVREPQALPSPQAPKADRSPGKAAPPDVPTGPTPEALKTWQTYVQARQGLTGALGALDTGWSGAMGLGSGPIVGRIPAATATQQTAEGAVSAMAPVLKQIFRVSGEGTFTDKDQALLLQMVPTRADEPAAREAKLKNIDNIIRAKLGIPQDTAATTAPTAASPNVVNFSDLPD